MLSPSASMTHGALILGRRPNTNSAVEAFVERPGPSRTAFLPLSRAMARGSAETAMVFSGVSAKGSVMSSAMALAMDGRTPAAVATVTRPAPVRSPARPASAAAPDLPREPAKMRRWP